MTSDPSAPVRLDVDRAVGLRDVWAVAHGAPVALDPAVEAVLDARRAEIVAHIRATEEPAYGFNRGFGHNVNVAVPAERLAELQLNLVRSHACGMGPPAPREVVRAAMFLRARSLARGHSGVRAQVVRGLVDLLNHHITPVVPVYGSVGASGDLAPLAHVALALLGEGEAFAPGQPAPVPAARALAAAGLEPLALQMKEGLALTNGVQFSTAYGVLACLQLEVLLKTAAIATALSCQVLLGSDAPFAAQLHALRPHPGSRLLARWVRDLMRGSPMRQAHASQALDWQVQDPYSLRCAAQVLGACHDLLADARTTMEVEANSVTDNPLLLPDEAGRFTRVVSGGHFHGMPVATRLYGLLSAAAVVAQLANLRCARYVDEDRNRGLGSDLIWPDLAPADRAASSGMMIPEYVSAALTNAVWGTLAPSHLLSIGTDAGQEDHVSMSAGLAARLWDTLPRVADVLAIELAYASQAAAIRERSPALATERRLPEAVARATDAARRAYLDALHQALDDPALQVHLEVRQSAAWTEAERALSPPCAAVVALVRETVPVLTRDRSLSGELRALSERVAEGEVVAAAERHVALGDEGNAVLRE